MKSARVLIAIMMVTVMAAGCSSASSTAEKKVPVKQTKEIKNFKETDIENVISGIDDRYILENAKEIDYLHDVKYDKKVVKKVEANTKKVDLSKKGTYKVKYIITIDTQALQEYLNKNTDFADNDVEQEKGSKEQVENGTNKNEIQAPNLKDEANQEKTEDLDEISKDDNKDKKNDSANQDIEIDKTVDVIDKDTAEDLVDKGETVWGDKNEPVKKEEEKETVDQQGEPVDKGTANKEQGTENAEAGSNNSGGTTTPSEPSKPSHTHTWVSQPATGHNETHVIQAAWDEPVYEYRTICNGCGADITNNIEHAAFCNGGSNYYNKNVQTGSVHHDAVTQSVYVQDSAAYTYCSGCGARQ